MYQWRILGHLTGSAGFCTSWSVRALILAAVSMSSSSDVRRRPEESTHEQEAAPKRRARLPV
eukprot:5352071-Prymnesium_polylepis.1